MSEEKIKKESVRPIRKDHGYNPAPAKDPRQNGTPPPPPPKPKEKD